MSSHEFGLCLKNIRKSRHKTQMDISKELGISRQAYSYYEQGLRLPDVKTLAELSVILDSNLFLYFMDAAMNIHRPSKKNKIPKSECSKLLEMYSSMSLSERLRILEGFYPEKSDNDKKIN